LSNDANILVTRRKDGTLVVAMWNVVDPDKKGAEQSVVFRLEGVASNNRVVIHRVDATHGNVLPAYEAMGKPKYPTQKQIEELNRASAFREPEQTSLKQGVLQIAVPVNGLVVMEVGQ